MKGGESATQSAPQPAKGVPNIQFIDFHTNPKQSMLYNDMIFGRSIEVRGAQPVPHGLLRAAAGTHPVRGTGGERAGGGEDALALPLPLQLGRLQTGTGNNCFKYFTFFSTFLTFSTLFV